MTHPHSITAPQQARSFVLAGRATFTLRSQRTSKHLTYRVVLNKQRSYFYVSALCGPDNHSDYRLLGTIPNDGRPKKYERSTSSKIAADAITQRAFSWFWRLLTTQDRIHPELEIWHEGKCGVCGRKLTVPESIASGIGPECAAKLAVPGLLAQLLGD